MNIRRREVNSASTSVRSALAHTWDLNVRAIPTSVVWAVCLMFFLQSPNVPTRLFCASICSIISLMNTSILKFSYVRVEPLQLVRTRDFQKVLLLNILVGTLSVLALDNLLNLKPSSMWLSLIISSTAITLIIAWIALMLILNPILIIKVATALENSIAELFILYVKNRKREVFFTGLSLVIFAPLIFIFISIALTLTQALTVISFEGLISKLELRSQVNRKVEIRNG